MSIRGDFRANKKKKLLSEINIVPYVDVTLILLIIFMITAPIVQQAVTVELPQTPSIDKKNNSKVAVKPFVITVTKNGGYKTSEDPKTILSSVDVAAEVIARSQLNSEQEFYIQADRLTEYRNVMHIFTVLKSNGVNKVSLLTTPES